MSPASRNLIYKSLVSFEQLRKVEKSKRHLLLTEFDKQQRALWLKIQDRLYIIFKLKLLLFGLFTSLTFISYFFKRYKNIARSKANIKPEVHTNQGVSRVPWEPTSEATGSIAEASPIASRQFNLDVKGWSKSKKDTSVPASPTTSNRQSKLSKEIKAESPPATVSNSNLNATKKRAYTRRSNTNTKKAQQDNNQPNINSSLDQFLTSSQLNIEVSEPSTSSSKTRVKRKITEMKK